jgi:hypothetical protein
VGGQQCLQVFAQRGNFASFLIVRCYELRSIFVTIAVARYCANPDRKPGVGGCKLNFNLISRFQFHTCRKEAGARTSSPWQKLLPSTSKSSCRVLSPLFRLRLKRLLWLRPHSRPGSASGCTDSCSGDTSRIPAAR